EPVSDEELRRAQTYAIGSHAIRQQSGAAVLGEMVDAWMFGRLGDLEEFENRVRAVTARGIMETARAYFDLDRRVEGIVRGVGKLPGGIGEHERAVAFAEQVVELVAEERGMTHLERVAIGNVHVRSRKGITNPAVVRARRFLRLP